MLSVKFELNISRVTEVKANYGMLTLQPLRVLAMQPKDLVKVNLNNMGEENGCDEKYEDVIEKNGTTKMHKTVTQKCLMPLEVDPDLEKSMTICQGIGRMLVPCCKLQAEKKPNLPLNKFLTQK